EPDIIIENIRVDSTEDHSSLRIKESDLTGHLDNGSKESEEKDEKNKTKKKEKNNEASLAETDYQLYEALNVLKGLAIHLKKTG
ncbi:MAG: carboxyl-terminal processing protease, partial [Gammaproteobacteria bacterium]